jgi:Ca2+-transporting ATPase
LPDPLVVVLLAAAVLTVATGDWTDAAVIALVVVVNTAVGVAQEAKADRAITALASLAAPRARVLRDARQAEIPAAEVVVGDLLILAEGNLVPADAAVVEAAALLVDEAALTGESVAVDKAANADPEQPGDTVSAGTVVVRGRGRAVVTATGADSAMGTACPVVPPKSPSCSPDHSSACPCPSYPHRFSGSTCSHTADRSRNHSGRPPRRATADPGWAGAEPGPPTLPGSLGPTGLGPSDAGLA